MDLSYSVAESSGVDPKICSVPFYDANNQACIRNIATHAQRLTQSVPNVLIDMAKSIQQRVRTNDKALWTALTRGVIAAGPFNSLAPVAPGECVEHAGALLAQLALTPEDVVSAMWLAVHEVHFHNDPDQAEGAAFLIWHLGGPEKSVDFPLLGRSLRMREGDALLFDGMQVHGVRLPSRAGQPFGLLPHAWLTDDFDEAMTTPILDDDVTVLYSLDFELTPTIAQRLGIEIRPLAHKKIGRTYRFEINEMDGSAVMLNQ